MNNKEDVAQKLYELVEKRLSTKEIVNKLVESANVILTSTGYDRVEELASKYKSSRKNLEGTAEELHKILKVTKPEGISFPDPLDFGITIKYIPCTVRCKIKFS